MKKVIFAIVVLVNLSILPLVKANLIDSLRSETINGKKIIIHKATKGETLLSLLRRYGGNVDQFKSYNATTEVILKEGNTYKFLYSGGTSKSAHKAPKGNINTGKGTDGNSIVVYKDLTLYSISKKYGHTVEDLKKWNNLSSNLIYPGQTIYFKEQSATTETKVTNNTQSATSSPNETILVDDNEIYTVVDQPAEYIGGNNDLSKFLSKTIKYPNEASRANVSGKVLVGFVVNKSGAISDVEVQNKLGYGLDEEAIRVVKAMPNWKPGKKSGKNINSKFVLPISFVLQE